MRKVTSLIKSAFEAGMEKRVSNTECLALNDRLEIRLHNNLIIERDPAGTRWTMAGWATRTTADRLNGILNVGLYCKRGQYYIGNDPVQPDAVFKLDSAGQSRLADAMGRTNHAE